MRNLLKLEFKKLFKTKMFWGALIIGTLLVVLQSSWAYRCIYQTNNETFMYYNEEGKIMSSWFETGILQGWLGYESYSSYNTLFYMIFPLLATMPYGLSLFKEWNYGYAAQIIMREKRCNYFISKYIVTFVSGGIVASYPLTLSLIVSACYLPAIGIDVMSLQGLANNDRWIEIFYEHPLLYAFIFIVLNFIHGGIFATITTVVSSWCINGFMALVFPMLLNIFLTMGLVNIFPVIRKYIPGMFINPNTVSEVFSGDVTIGITVVLVLIIVVLYWLNNKKLDELE